MAVVISQIKSSYASAAEKKRLINRRLLVIEAKSLATACGFSPTAPVLFRDLPNICSVTDLNIVVVSGDGTNRRMYPKETNSIDRRIKPIFLEYIEYADSDLGHFNVITKINGYVEASAFCIYCWSKSRSLGAHHCIDTCESCLLQKTTCDESQPVSCQGCKRICYGPTCLTDHQRSCKKYKTCNKCLLRYRKTKEDKHDCFERNCTKCGIRYDTRNGWHYCNIKKLDKYQFIEEDTHMKVTVAFDIESMLVPTEEDPSVKEHIADLLISKAKCDFCMTLADEHWTRCVYGLCELTPRIFKGDQNFSSKKGCVTDFCTYIYEDLAKRAEAQKAKVYVYAHNLSAYDGRFIFRDLFNRDYGRPEFIQEGSKIIYLKIGNVRFIDSLKLFALPLKQLPKAFGLTAVKGWFPYEANVVRNRNQVIPLPPKEDFGYKTTMKPADQKSFDEWYVEQPPLYDLEAEKLKYCNDDVKILLGSILAFRKKLKETNGFDSTVRKFTMASIGMETFRSLHLPDSQTLARTPTGGYGFRKSSVTGDAYLDSVEDCYGITLTREISIGKYFADGYHRETNTVYEYDGCRYHGCSCVFEDENEIVAPLGRTVRELREHLNEKYETYRRLGLNVVTATDCNNPLLVETKKRAKKIFTNRRRLKDLDYPDHLRLRDGLKGGRTNNLKFYFESTESTELRYVDFTSLYPSVLKNRKYPKGHPERITRNFKNIEEYFGMVYCEVKPPENLHVPVLGINSNGKFLFPLCRKCGDTRATSECTHTDADRNLIGVWTTPELLVALHKGYQIVELFEVLHFEESHNDLFTPYINKFLREKQEAEGKMGMSDEELDKYIQDYLEKEGIPLRKQYITDERNMAARTMAKLFLNSFWGKMAQRANLTQHQIFNNHDEYIELIMDPKFEILGELSIDENNMIVSYKLRNDEDANEGVQNVILASFVTSYARIELYSIIDEVENENPGGCYYFDTDSLIYEVRNGNDVLEKYISPYLGGLTSELSTGSKIVAAAFNGSKCYAYVEKNGDTMKTVTKVKGLTLTAEAEKTVNIDSMTTLAMEFENDNITDKSRLVIDQFRITTDPRTQKLYSTVTGKSYQVTSDKRIVLPLRNETVPYGFRPLPLYS